MIIAAKVIKKPRKLRRCEGWRHYSPMDKGQPCMRLYGSATRSDPLYVKYLCLDCAKEVAAIQKDNDGKKVKMALDAYNK